MVVGDILQRGDGNVCLLRKRDFYVVCIDKRFTLAVGDDCWNAFLKLQVGSIKDKLQATGIPHRQFAESWLEHLKIRDVSNSAHIENSDLIAHRFNLGGIELPKRVIEVIGQDKDVAIIFSKQISQIWRGNCECFGLKHTNQNRNLGFGIIEFYPIRVVNR